MWLPYSDNYEVSEESNVRNKKTGRILKACANSSKYLCVKIHGKSKLIHRIVAERFLPAPTEEGLEVDHIDRNKTNNNASNLRWVTHQVNSQNLGMYKSNTSGHTCIQKTRYNTFQVQIISNQIRLYRKTFKTLKEAIEARDKFTSS